MAQRSCILFRKDKGVGGETIHALVYDDVTGELYVNVWADAFIKGRGFADRLDDRVEVANYLAGGRGADELKRIIGELPVDRDLGLKLVGLGVFDR